MKLRKIILCMTAAIFSVTGFTGCGKTENANTSNEEAVISDSESSVEYTEENENIGSFITRDINGEIYTEEIFKEYDLTLVNIFATWCSPCVQEMPELEELRQEYEEKDVKFGVVAVVLDAKTAKGTDEEAVKQAQLLADKSGAKFPFLIPDGGYMNGHLSGIESVPESFFVDQNGNIVSEPYIGANSKEGWMEIVENELTKLKGGGA